MRHLEFLHTFSTPLHVRSASSGDTQAVGEHRSPMIAATRGSKLGASLGMTDKLSRGRLEAQSHRRELQKYEQVELNRLEELLRQRAANPKAMLQSLHLQPFADVRSTPCGSEAGSIDCRGWCTQARGLCRKQPGSRHSPTPRTSWR